MERAIEWKWSSFGGYYCKTYYPVGLLDVELILGMISAKREKHYNELVNWVHVLTTQKVR